MKIHIDEITADIEAADFSTDAAALTFRAKMCSDYCARELFTYEGFLPRWSFKTQGEKQRFVRTWEQITLEARSLISQARALGAGAIKNRLVRGANGAMLPHPQMGDDLDDGLFDMSVVTLRQTVARALENNATVQDVAKDAKRGADAAERVDKRLPKPRADKGQKHTTRKNRKAASVGGVKFTAAWLAGVLNKSRFQPEKGAGWMGTCTTKKIEQWDGWCSDHPGEENGYGYRTELRTDAGMYDALLKFIENWDRHWKDYKAEFTKWRKDHANNPRKDFRFRPMRRTDIDTERIGIDSDGSIIIRSVSDDEKLRLKKVMSRKKISPKHLRPQHF